MSFVQNDISGKYFNNENFEKKKTLEEVLLKTKFLLEGKIVESNWWTSKKAGAITVRGKYSGQDASLKIQLIKVDTSEIDNIENFEKQNKSKMVRPPRILWSEKWNGKYEAIIMEDVGAKTVINQITNEEEIDSFFDIYNEYRKNCRNNPWLLKPNESIGMNIKRKFEIWRKISFDLYKDHPLRQKTDAELIDKAIQKLDKEYEKAEWEFVHGHFGVNDVYEKGGSIVLLSNLYWGWRAPNYDKVFAYQWYIYHLSEIEGMTEKAIEEQRKLWMKNFEVTKYMKAALLERAVAGLNLDVLSLDTDKPITKYLVERTREIVSELLK